MWNWVQMNATKPQWWLVTIGSGNGLMPSGNKPLPEPVLTQICDHIASLGQNELIIAWMIIFAHYPDLTDDCSELVLVIDSDCIHYCISMALYQDCGNFSVLAINDKPTNMTSTCSNHDILSNLKYKVHQIPKFKCFSSRLCSCLCPIHWS